MNKGVFDIIIHAPQRLQICALLSSIGELEFQIIRDKLELSDSALSKHIKMLSEADYVVVSKKGSGGRSYKWISLTSKGKRAFKGHVQALKSIVE